MHWSRNAFPYVDILADELEQTSWWLLSANFFSIVQMYFEIYNRAPIWGAANCASKCILKTLHTISNIAWWCLRRGKKEKWPSLLNLQWISDGKALEIRLANDFMLPIYCSNYCPSFTSGHPIHIALIFSLTPLIENLALLWGLGPCSGFDSHLGKGFSVLSFPFHVSQECSKTCIVC